MLTFEVFLSFSFFSFCFIFYVRKNNTPIIIYEKNFFFVHLHSYTRRTFSVYTHIKTLSLYINTVYIQTLFLFKDFFFVFFNIHSQFIQKFLYIHSLLTHKNFFSHLIYTHKNFFSRLIYTHTKISFHTLFTHTQNLSIHFLHIKNSFLYFIYRHDICSQRLFPFFFILGVIMIFLFILFLGRRS